MNTLYPLKFKPVFKEKIWGGNRIRTHLGLNFGKLPNCGEAWVLSGVKGSQTKVSNGFLKGNELNELVEVFMDDLVGEKVFEKHREEFPLLVKFIDSNDYLSIQVHPDDKLAAKRGIGSGKTEMWYILDADPEAVLFTGFNQKIDRETYLEHLRTNKLKELMNIEPVQAGDVFYIPSGRVHALGPGVLLAEIQQTSDITYRIYDWDRVDDQGKSRELHTELALDAIDFNHYDSYRTNYRRVKNRTETLVNSPYFVTKILDLTEETHKDYTYQDSFIVYICVEGSAHLIALDHEEILNKGEVLLLPAITGEVYLRPVTNCRILEVSVP